MPIMDCDEVYNYWEPLHFLVHGTGLQTWEYAHEYALRTYAYILPLKLLTRFIYEPLLPYFYPLLPLLVDDLVYNKASFQSGSYDKIIVFVLLRCTLDASSAKAAVAPSVQRSNTKTIILS